MDYVSYTLDIQNHFVGRIMNHDPASISSLLLASLISVELKTVGNFQSRETHQQQHTTIGRLKIYDIFTVPKLKVPRYYIYLANRPGWLFNYTAITHATKHIVEIQIDS